eukprot:TRINITY_DN1813_c0_g1_i4.p3 TRINITY_DN1813_c0_g1~~TRINITY_DN1813_c0_g1_i4.p3  ORF type:complete len:107 (-),score=18.18 TRINITY_DN1813_c0_g1_i4:22-342(-)
MFWQQMCCETCQATKDPGDRRQNTGRSQWATESDDGRSPWEVLLHRCRAVANEENKRMPWDRAAAMAEVLARQGQHACLTQALLKGSYGSFLFVSDQIWTSKMVRK